MYVNRQK